MGFAHAAPALCFRPAAAMTAPVITAIVTTGTVEASSDLPVPWWSFTKTVLAAAALVLVDAGRLALDEPPGLYIGHTRGGPGSTAAVYQRSPGGERTVAVFAPFDQPGWVDQRAMALAWSAVRPTAIR